MIIDTNNEFHGHVIILSRVLIHDRSRASLVHYMYQSNHQFLADETFVHLVSKYTSRSIVQFILYVYVVNICRTMKYHAND